MKEKSFNFK